MNQGALDQLIGTPSNGKQAALGFTPNSANKGRGGRLRAMGRQRQDRQHLPAVHVDDVLDTPIRPRSPHRRNGQNLRRAGCEQDLPLGQVQPTEISASPGSTDAVTEGLTNPRSWALACWQTVLAGLLSRRRTPWSRPATILERSASCKSR